MPVTLSGFSCVCFGTCKYLLTYAHRSRWSIGHQRPLASHCSGLLWSFWTSWFPAVSALLQCLASNCCEAGLFFSSPAGSGQGLACGAGCWLPEGVSDPAPLPPQYPQQYLLGLWFLSGSLPQIFISDLILPLNFVDAPHTGVVECLDLSLHRLCCPPCLTSVEQDWFTLELKMRSLVLMLTPPDAQMFLSRYMQVPCLNFKKNCTPLWDNCTDGTILLSVTTG